MSDDFSMNNYQPQNPPAIIGKGIDLGSGLGKKAGHLLLSVAQHQSYVFHALGWRTCLASAVLLMLFSAGGEKVYAAPPSERLTTLQRLTTDGDSVAPVFSPTDPHLMAFTKQKYTGIYLLRLNTLRSNSSADTKAVTTTPESGFAFSWTPDGESIIFRSRDRKIRYVGMVDINNQQHTNFSGDSAEVSVPVVRQGNVFFMKDQAEVMVDLSKYGKRLTRTSPADNATLTEAEQTALSVLGQHGRIMVGREYISDPEKKCFLPLVSPDDEKLSFECLDGLYVYHFSTKQTIYLGKGTSPRWSSDSRKLVYEQTTDDGYVITSSDVFIINHDGSQKVNLTADLDLIVRRPSLNVSGNILAVDIEGDIYVANLQEDN